VDDEVKGGEATATAPVAEARPGVDEATRRRRWVARFPETGALIVVLAGLIIFFSIRSEFFLTQDNLINILSAVAVLGILSCPATMLLISGQFDLSVASGVALTSCVLGYGIAQGGSELLYVLAAIGVGLGIGVANGFLVTVVGINSIITTLGMLAVLRGLAQLRTDGQSIGFEGFSELGLGRPLFDVPWSVFIFLGVVVLSVFLMRFTTYGRSLYAIGANPVAARLAGIRVGRVILLAFVLSGLAIAVAGLIVASETGQASGNAALGLELSVVTAVILGGASLAGGRGTILGTILGVLILGVITNGLTLLSVSTFWQDITRGSLLIVAVGVDQLRLRLTQAR
jgi:ribose transport system permease protein